MIAVTDVEAHRERGVELATDLLEFAETLTTLADTLRSQALATLRSYEKV